MCLAIPMRLTEIHGDMGTAELNGVRREVGLHLIQDAKVGDYVIVHAGFAIEKMNEQEAMETIALLEEAAALVEQEGTP